MLAMSNLAIHLGYHRLTGARQPAGTLPPCPSRSLSLAAASESYERYGALTASCLSVLLCRIDTHSSCRDPQYAASGAPIELIDGTRLVKILNRSRKGELLPPTYKAMCGQCGDIV